MSEEWSGAAAWWREEVDADGVFTGDVMPLLTDLLGDAATDGATTPWLDLGCGEGRVMRALAGDGDGAGVIGCDLSLDLARTAARSGPVVRCLLPDLRWLRPGSLAGAYAVLVVEHLADLPGFFSSVWRAVSDGGALVMVANHPAFTAAGSGPIVDLADGEVLWRWGPYTTPASATTELSAGRLVTFHHRPLGDLLGVAAGVGWHLEACVERPLSAEAIEADPGFRGQGFIPRLLGVRWRRQRQRRAV